MLNKHNKHSTCPVQYGFHSLIEFDNVKDRSAHTSNFGVHEMENEKENQHQSFDPVHNYPYGVWRERIGTTTLANAPLNTLVSGSNRCKYFNQPLTRIYKKPEYQLLDEEFYWKNLQEPEPLKYVTVGTQTVFRESETQTDPWDPPYKVKKILNTPEILTIASLHYGKGLPVTGVEVEEISRDRSKREWEQLLPPITNEETEMKKRHKMIVEQKVKEINYAKDKIKAEHEMKLTYLESSLAFQLQERKKQKEIMLESLWANKRAELQEKKWKLHGRLLKQLQKLERNRRELGENFADDNQDFQTSSFLFDSSLYHKKVHQTPTLDHFYLGSVKGLVELEKWLWEEQKIVMQPEIYGPKRDTHPTRLQKIIEQAQREMSKRKAAKSVNVKAEKKFIADRPQSRPSTPTVPNIQQYVLDRNFALIYIQRVLRGRSLQKEVLEVHNKYVDLINEFKKTHTVSKSQKENMDQRKTENFIQYMEEKIKKDKILCRQEVLSRFEGKVISDTLNILGKAENRHRICKQIDCLVLTAKDDRRRLEAEEAGRRQKEVQNQRILDKVFIKICRDKED